MTNDMRVDINHLVDHELDKPLERMQFQKVADDLLVGKLKNFLEHFSLVVIESTKPIFHS